MENPNYNSLPMQTLDAIPTPNANAKKISALVKQKGRVVGYQLEDKTILDKTSAINLARSGGIRGVGIAHKKETEYLKSLPDGDENNNLGNLPSIAK